MKNAKKRKYVIGIWVIMTFVLTNNYILTKCLEKYECAYQPIAKGITYDYGVVLAGVASFDSFSRSIQLGEPAERITEPIFLYKKGIVKKIIITGGSANVFPPYIKESVYIRRFWLAMGIPDSDIIIESEARNTKENAKFTKELIEKRGGSKKILLITSALHMPRSKYIFKKMGLLVDIYSVDFRVKRINLGYDISNYFIPKVDALEGWQALIHEWVGMLAAKI